MARPPIPSLIIGLGGTGALTVMHVKQQLLDVYDNTIPDSVGLLVLDTAKDPLAQFTAGQTVRMEGMGFGAIQLAPREKGHLGGDAFSMIQRVAAGKDSPDQAHLASWLKAEWYLNNAPRELLYLENGAGMFRQMGRLALFKDVAAPGTSQFYRLVDEKISSLQISRGAERSLAVFIVGSLAGGTGAGLFIDTAYLVKQIARSHNYKVQIRGYFFLPDTFKATLNATAVQGARGRSFAALRELSRFMLHSDYELGYPFYYHSRRSTDHTELWRGRLKEKLYQLVYLIDGQSSNNPLRDYPVWAGVTPSVADAILSFIDSHAGEYQNAYIVNVGQNITQQQTTKGNVPYVGAVGAYTVILPIQQMIDEWAFKLGKEATEILLKPADYDRSSNIPTALRIDQNLEREDTPQEEVERLLRGRAPIADPREKGKTFTATRLWSKVYDWYHQRQQPGNKTVKDIVTMDAEGWLSTLTGSATETGAEVARAERRATRAIEIAIEDKIELSDETDPRSDPATDFRRIESDVKKFFNVYLGYPQEGGRREGGEFREALQEFIDFQLNRFWGAIEAYMAQQLNGQNALQPKIARQGKLGWAIAISGEMQIVFNEVLALIHEAKNNRNAAVDRGHTLEAMDAASEEMKELREQTRAIPGRTSKAIQAQRDYRDAAQAVMDMHRAEIARDAVEQIVAMMLAYVTGAKDQLDNWARVLGTHHNGVYAQMYRGEEKVKVERQKSGNIPCRKVLNDLPWEQKQYTKYKAQSDAENAALKNITWNVNPATDLGGKPVMRIEVQVGNTLLRDDYSGNWEEYNARTLLDMCRGVFASAREQESVLHYLAEKYDGRSDKLAEELYEKSSELLSFDQGLAPSHDPAVYLLAFDDTGQANDAAFLNEVMQKLREYHHVRPEDETMARRLPGDDRFRLTVVCMDEIILLSALTTHKEAENAYLRAATGERERYHIFPAEVQSVQYEDQFPTVLQQSRRTISSRVAVMLENIERFREFHALMAHQIIALDRDYRDKAETNFVYFLTTNPVDPDSPYDSEEWWLTRPARNPSLLEAMTTYLFREEDYGMKKYDENFIKVIDYEHVQRYLLNLRQYETDERVAAGVEDNIAKYNKNLRDLIGQCPSDDPKFPVLTRIIVEHDCLKEHAAYLETQIKRLQQNPVQARQADGGIEQRQDQQRAQEWNDLVDLYSVSIIVVNEMITARYRDAYIAAGYRQENIPSAANSGPVDRRR